MTQEINSIKEFSFESPVQVTIYNPNTGVTSEFEASSVKRNTVKRVEHAPKGAPCEIRLNFPRTESVHSYELSGIQNEEIIAALGEGCKCDLS